jgi:uncharacterized protein YkwD
VGRRTARRSFIALLALPIITVAGFTASRPTPVAAASGNEDWLTSVNHFRAQAGLQPVAENPAYTDASVAHSCYMIANGISHDEVAGRPGYTAAGSAAGLRSNVAVSSVATATDRSFVELWIAAPYHAIGILRAATTSMSYGACRDGSSSPWRSGATLDVVSGMGSAPLAAPVVWPGNGSRTDLYRFVSESPSPVTECGWTGPAGLPIVALLPEAPTGATAQLTGPGGPVPTCVLTAANSTNSTAKAILDGDNGVVILPRTELAPGSYTVALSTSSRTVNWTFTVDPAAADWNNGSSGPAEVQAPTGTSLISMTGGSTGFSPLPPQRLVDSRTGLGATRLQAGVATPVQIGGTGPVPAGTQAVSINLTAVAPAAAGYLSAYPCNSSPVVSSVNFPAGIDTPNAALVPLDGSGMMCLFSSVDTDVLVDVNGALLGTAPGRFMSLSPNRLADSRQGLGLPGRIQAGSTQSVTLAGGGSPVPAGASAIVMNVTAVDPANDGFVSVYPCGSSPPVVSSLNPRQGETRPNLVVVPLGAGGTVCFYSTSTTDLLVDVTGYVQTSGTRFNAVTPTRLADTRVGLRLTAGGTLRVPVAGARGLPQSTTAIAANITAVGPSSDGYITAYGCGDPLPATSTLNLQAGNDAANGAQVQLGDDGDLCLYSTVATDLIVDINGIWS